MKNGIEEALMRSIMSAAMRGRKDEDEDEEVSKISPEVKIMELQQYFEHYVDRKRFKPGDVITPKKSSPLKGAGQPCVVVEVLDEPVFNDRVNDPLDASSHMFGAKFDIRVATYHEASNSSIVFFMAESPYYEEWKPKS